MGRPVIDETGNQYGRWTVIKSVKKPSTKQICWLCRCLCGTEKVILGSSLRNGDSKSCGCLRDELNSDRSKDRTGEKYGELTVMKKHYLDNEWYWWCQCSCGEFTSVRGSHLTTGGTQRCPQCGIKHMANKKTTHGLSGTLEYARMSGKRRRDRKKNLDVKWTAEKEIALRELFTSCVVCGSTENLQVDHIKPLSKGFGLSVSNATILCQSCNRKKSDTMPSQLPPEMRIPILKAAKAFKKHWKENYG